MQDLSKHISLLATANIFVIMVQALAVVLILLLMSVSHKFIIPYAPIFVFIVAISLSAYLAKTLHHLISNKLHLVTERIQKIILAALAVITAGVIYGTMSGL